VEQRLGHPDAPRHHRAAFVAFAAVVGIAGAWLAMAAIGQETVPMGPFHVQLQAVFGPGRTVIALPPFGRLEADTHTAPLQLTATFEDIGIHQLTDSIQSEGLDGLAREVQHAAGVQVVRYGFRLLAISVIGAIVLGAVVFRASLRAIGIGVLAAILAVGGSELLAWQTFKPAAFTTPTYTGTLATAAKLIGPVREAANSIQDFRVGLESLIAGASRAYTSIQTTPLTGSNVIRVLHISDIHESVIGIDFAREIAQNFDVDFVIDTGDITSFGTPVEDLISTKIPAFGRPYVFVRGSHDTIELQHEIGRLPNGITLDGTETTIDGLTIYGLGDLSFTPAAGEPTNDKVVAAQARTASGIVSRDVTAMPHPPDVVAVHDDRMAASVAGYVPLVISGHFHENRITVVDGTLYLRVGTTGGSGAGIFRGLDVPLSAEVLYFDRTTRRLLAYDLIEEDIQTGALTVHRHVISEEFGTLEPSPPPATPSVTASVSPTSSPT
jgi:predicted phosphodiesterase